MARHLTENDSLAVLTEVENVAPVDGQILAWNAGTGRWEWADA